jgi:SAM-dependent methyltransferase
MDELFKDVEALLSRVKIDFGGGCSVTKAYLMARLIRDERLKTTLDIGVYRGRSLFPQALAHRQYTSGVVYGVDPWDAAEAVQEQAPEAIADKVKTWAAGTDLQNIYEEVVALTSTLDLGGNITLVREPSSKAIDYFRTRNILFDLVHIDGNHDTARVREDLDHYLPRLRPGGYLVLDDVSWASIRPLYQEVKSRLSHVFELVDSRNDFAIFWNSSDWLGAQQRRARYIPWRVRHVLAKVKGRVVRLLKANGRSSSQPS